MTSDRATLLGLADEVERLEGPDRGELNWRIAVAIGDIPAPREQPFFRFTNSIDAAAGIMPDGWLVSVAHTLAGGWSAWARRSSPLMEQATIPHGGGKTEALARTAAALRAMAVGVGDDR